MLLGMPVIASNAGGITSVISENEGYIFERGDVNELAELIERVLILSDENSEELILKDEINDPLTILIGKPCP